MSVRPTCRSIASRAAWRPARRCCSQGQARSAPLAAATAKKKQAASPSALAERLTKAAGAAFEGGQFEACAKACTQALQLGPNAPAYELLAKCCAIRGESRAALDYFTQAAAADPTHWTSRVAVADCVVVHDVASGEDAWALAEQHAREALGILELQTSAAALVEARAAHIRCHWLLSRLAQIRRDGQAASMHLFKAKELASKWLDKPTSRLPRVEVPKSSTRHISLPGRDASLPLRRLAKFPLLLHVSGLLTKAECEYVIDKARPLLQDSSVHYENGHASRSCKRVSAHSPAPEHPPLHVSVRAACRLTKNTDSHGPSRSPPRSITLPTPVEPWRAQIAPVGPLGCPQAKTPSSACWPCGWQRSWACLPRRCCKARRRTVGKYKWSTTGRDSYTGCTTTATACCGGMRPSSST